MHSREVDPVGNEAAGINELPRFVNRWQMPLGREVDDALAMQLRERIDRDYGIADARRRRPLQRNVEESVGMVEQVRGRIQKLV